MVLRQLTCSADRSPHAATETDPQTREGLSYGVNLAVFWRADSRQLGRNFRKAAAIISNPHEHAEGRGASSSRRRTGERQSPTGFHRRRKFAPRPERKAASRPRWRRGTHRQDNQLLNPDRHARGGYGRTLAWDEPDGREARSAERWNGWKRERGLSPGT